MVCLFRFQVLRNAVTVPNATAAAIVSAIPNVPGIVALPNSLVDAAAVSTVHDDAAAAAATGVFAIPARAEYCDNQRPRKVG
mmetsp:Transcript_4328/g.7966  ORF Transcript_4328/g.7966 Transcript_4328/m.7966 type:complete len:82 (-) Transcript_4328:33-278(-)